VNKEAFIGWIAGSHTAGFDDSEFVKMLRQIEIKAIQVAGVCMYA